MPPPIPHRPPRPSGAKPPSPPRRPAPPARPHPGYMYEERRASSSSTSSYRSNSTSTLYTSSTTTSAMRTTVSSSSGSGSGFSSYLSSGFASRARAALSTAGSMAVSAAGTVAAAAASGSEHRDRGLDGNAPGAGKKQTWEEWARDWRDGRRAAIKGTETLYVVPGWAVKRPQKDGDQDAFDLHVSVSGFCNFVRDPGSTSRTQRAIMGIAKRFAALPVSPILQATFQAEEMYDSPSEPQGLEGFSKLHVDHGERRERPGPNEPLFPLRRTTTEVFADPQQLAAAHGLMDTRLAPFWSSVLAYRRVAISMYPVPLKRDSVPPQPDAELFAQEPLMRTTFTTNAQGHFSHTVVVPWERLCTHPQSLPMAFADDPASDRTDWGVIVRAELLSEEGPNRLRPASNTSDAFGPADSRHGSRAPSMSPSLERSTTGNPLPYVPRRVSGATSFFSAAEEPNRNDGDGSTEMGLMGLGKTMVETWTTVDFSRPGGIRVISDLDDTVKHTDILSGPREVFRNVFCRDLNDSVVPGMDDLYTELTKLGLSGLHFVSNSPFELFPVISEFFRRNRFPAYYSLKLKFYGGRSIVSSLFEGAGQRKRPNVLEVMDEFYDSRFILIGDSGEQDLELYAAIAHERPEQVAAIFIRDVTSKRVDELRRGATDYSEVGDVSMGPDTPSSASAPASIAPRSGRASQATSGRSSPTGTPGQLPKRSTTADDLAQTVDDLQQLSAAEAKILRRAAEWETRVAKAYAEIPPEVALVFFEHVEEIESMSKELVREGRGVSLPRPPGPIQHTDVGTQDGDSQDDLIRL